MARSPEERVFGGLPLLRGLIHLARYEFDDAIRQCEAGIVLSVAPPGLHIHARCLIAVGQIDRAYQQAMKSIELQPDIFPFYLTTLGVAALLRGQSRDAVLVLEKARMLMPHLPHCAGLLAAALEAHGRHADAGDVVTALGQIDPRFSIRDVLRPYPTRDIEYQATLSAYLRAAGMRRE